MMRIPSNIGFLVTFALVATGIAAYPSTVAGTEADPGSAAKRSPAAYDYEPPPSRWLLSTEATALAYLARNPADVLVVPFQAKGATLDNAGRSLMAMSLSEAIEARTTFSVANPMLVDQAFASGTRSIAMEKIEAVAEAVRASVVILGHVGHDGDNNLTLNIERFDVRGGKLLRASRVEVASYSDVAFSDERPPYFAFRDLRARIVTAIFGSTDAKRRRDPSSKTGAAGLPASVEDLDRRLREFPQDAATLLQILAATYPSNAQRREMERLYVRSIVLVDGVGSRVADGNVALARGLAHLNRRPAAIRLLKTHKSPEAAALLAYLDGNLPALEAAESKLQTPTGRLLASLDLARLRGSYDREGATGFLEELAGDESFWSHPIRQYLVSNDVWSNGGPLLVKLALDAQFPLPQHDLALTARAKFALGMQPDAFELSSQTFEHIADLGAESSRWKDSAAAMIFAAYWREVLAASVAAELKRRDKTLGRPDAAVEHSDKLRPLFADHPVFELVRAEAQWSFSEKLPTQIKAAMEPDIYEALRRSAIWPSAQTAGAETYLMVNHQFFPGSEKMDDDSKATMFFAADWPENPGWGFLARRLDLKESAEQCIRYTVTRFQCVSELDAHLRHRPPGDDALQIWLESEVERRFHGHPARTSFLSSRHKQSGDPDAAKSVLLDAVEAGTTEWRPYRTLAVMHAIEGRPQDSVNVALQYPLFGRADSSARVALSNRAYEVGSYLYWAGAYEQARPLYELAAGYGTGSAADMASRVRLALLDHDYAAALGETVRRVRRYESAYAMRDMISLLVLLGQPEEAEMIAEGITPLLNKPVIWHGLLNLHRYRNYGLDEIVRWAHSAGRDSHIDKSGNLAERYVFIAGVLDRVADQKLVDILADENSEVPARMEPSRPYTDPEFPNRERYVLYRLAKAMASFHAGDYAAAATEFRSASQVQRLAGFLPYHVLASVKAEEDHSVRRYVSTLERRKQINDRLGEPGPGANFDYYLANAVLLGMDGDVSGALGMLIHANAAIRHTENRLIFTRYQVLDIAEILFSETGDERFRDFLVDLARRNAIIEPSNAWAHAFLAKHTQSGSERLRAATRALALDPQSHRANQLNPQIVEKAAKAAKAGFPGATGSEST